jgi:hypothetical protein
MFEFIKPPLNLPKLPMEEIGRLLLHATGIPPILFIDDRKKLMAHIDGVIAEMRGFGLTDDLVSDALEEIYRRANNTLMKPEAVAEQVKNDFKRYGIILTPHNHDNIMMALKVNVAAASRMSSWDITNLPQNWIFDPRFANGLYTIGIYSFNLAGSELGEHHQHVIALFDHLGRCWESGEEYGDFCLIMDAWQRGEIGKPIWMQS